jgi:DNA-binding MurR/RpiR family transcriptional regulator
MDPGLLSERVVAQFDGLSAQLQVAARYVLDHPRDVALLSMREQARKAGVRPATMTRFAKSLGLSGYDAIRSTYADALRGGALDFANKAGAQLESQKLRGDKALAAEMIAILSAQLARLAEPDALDRLVTAADHLVEARRIYCLGLRSSHSVAWHAHYILSFFGDRSVFLDAIAGVGADQLRDATREDVLLVVSIAPYTKATVEIAQYAASLGVTVIAITDSPVAPLAQLAKSAILVPTESPSFFHTMSPAFVMAEILTALVAGRGGHAALNTVRQMERQLIALDVHLKPRPARPAP